MCGPLCVRTSVGIEDPRFSLLPVKRHRGEPGHTRDTRDTRAHALLPVKRYRGEPGHTRDTHGTHGRTRAHGSHRRTSQPSKPNDTPARPRDGRNRGRLNSRSRPRGGRSRPLPAADLEEAAPSEPDPASTRSQSASPRLLEGGRRNEGARGRRVTAGGGRCGPLALGCGQTGRSTGEW